MSSNLTTVTGKKNFEFATDSIVKILAHCLTKFKKETESWELLVKMS